MLSDSPTVMNKRRLGSMYLIGFSLGFIVCVLSWYLMCINMSVFNGFKLLNS